MDQTTLTTCPVRLSRNHYIRPHVQSHHSYILQSTCGTHMTATFVQSIQFTSSYHQRLGHITDQVSSISTTSSLYSRSHHPTLQKTTLSSYRFMSKSLSLEHTIPPSHNNDITLTTMSSMSQSNHYIRTIRPTYMEQTTLTTCPVCSVQLHYIRTYVPHTWNKQALTTSCPALLSPTAILEHTSPTYIWNKQH